MAARVRIPPSPHFQGKLDYICLMRLHKQLWWLVSGIWESYYPNAKERKLVKEVEEAQAKGEKVQAYERILCDMAKEPGDVRLKRHLKNWSWFFGREVKGWWRANFKSHWCKHERLSDGKWDFQKGGYRYCYSCWKNFYDQNMKIDDCNLVEEIGA